jgi:hypothetical protein
MKPTPTKTKPVLKLKHILEHKLPHVSAIMKRAALECRRLGGELVRLPREQEALLYELNPDTGRQQVYYACPFDIRCGVLYRARMVVYVDDELTYGTLIHEMAHCFASTSTPSSSQEFQFLGWEYALAGRWGARRKWLKDSRNYVISDHGADIGDMLRPSGRPNATLQKVFMERLVVARELGLVVGLDDKPMSVRSKR